MDESTNFIAVASCGIAKHENINRVRASYDVARGLARLLVMTRALCYQSLYCHWQASDPEFENLHSLFEQHYQSLRKAIDIIAQRINELGFEPPDQFSKAAWKANEKDSISDTTILADLILRHRQCALEAQAIVMIADYSDDEISAHIASQRQAVHEKIAWFLMTLTENSATTHSVM